MAHFCPPHWKPGSVNQLDLTVASSAIEDGLPSAVYAFNLPKMLPHARAAAAEMGVPVREFQLLHELLGDLLQRAGLPGPALELAKMADDRPERGMIAASELASRRDVG